MLSLARIESITIALDFCPRGWIGARLESASVDVITDCSEVIAFWRFMASHERAFLSKVYTAGVFLLAGISVYLIRSTDPDLWWHIKAGEMIAATGEVPRYDTFSFTAPHAKWIDHEWGTHLVFYVFYHHFGDGGFTLFKTMLRFLSREKLGSKVPAAFSIPLLFLVCANLHGSFLAGVALLAAHVVIPPALAVFQRQRPGDEWARARPLALTLLISTFVTLANPYGLGLWEGLARELAVHSVNHQQIREWAPIWATSLGMQALLLVVFAVLTTVAFALRPALWRGEEIMLVAGTFALGVYSIRNIPFFAMVAAALWHGR